MNRRAAVWINPYARRGNVQNEVLTAQLETIGIEVIPSPHEDIQQWVAWLRQSQSQLDLIIIGGGDGTLNRLVDHLIDLDLPLGILPLGTANDLARTLGIPRSLEAACQILVSGQSRRIDLGCVNGKHFFNVASLGLSVQVTKQLSRGLKRRWGIFAYAITAIQVLWQMHAFPAEIRISNQSFPVKTVQIAVGNGRFYGGGLEIARDAQIDDQRLDLYSLEIKHWWQILFLLPAIKTGRFYSQRHARFLSATQVEIHTPLSQQINTDGELTTETPARFHLVPHALTILVPKDIASKRP